MTCVRATFYCGRCQLAFDAGIRFFGPCFEVPLRKKGEVLMMDCPAHAGISTGVFEGRRNPITKN